MPKKILVADDEANIRTMVSEYLNKMGFETVTASNGTEALHSIEAEGPDLVLLDVMMPSLDGFTLAKQLINRFPIPIVFMTARTEEIDRVLGLELGADDYITKPFSLRELVARIQAVLRRVDQPRAGGANPATEDTIRWKDLEVDVPGARVQLRSQILELTALQFRILLLFLRSPGKVFSRPQILTEVLGVSLGAYERTIDVHMKNLRKLLRDDVKNPQYIETVRGLGYRLAR